VSTPIVAAPSRPRVQTWVERLTILRAMRTIAIIVALLVLIGAVLVRLLEPKTFDDFGLACWWAVETVSTVGYGDVVPVTTPGRLVGTVLMVAGVSMIPLVTSVVVSILTAKRAQILHDEQAAQLTRLEERLERLER
jgi:voltage-gated potassium channel